MAVQLINIGHVANDGTGDDLREAMLKINQNFEELDLRDDEQTTASNLGSVGEGLFSNKINYDLQFKRLAPGENISLTADAEKIIIDTSNVLKQLRLTSDNGNETLEDTASLSILGGDGITTSIENGILTVTNNYVSTIADDKSPELGGSLNANGYDITNANNIHGSFIGNLTGNVNGVDPSKGAYYFSVIDLGDVSKPITNTIELLLTAIDVDLGTFDSPSVTSFDGGVF